MSLGSLSWSLGNNQWTFVDNWTMISFKNPQSRCIWPRYKKGSVELNNEIQIFLWWFQYKSILYRSVSQYPIYKFKLWILLRFLVTFNQSTTYYIPLKNHFYNDYILFSIYFKNKLDATRIVRYIERMNRDLVKQVNLNNINISTKQHVKLCVHFSFNWSKLRF